MLSRRLFKCASSTHPRRAAILTSTFRQQADPRSVYLKTPRAKLYMGAFRSSAEESRDPNRELTFACFLSPAWIGVFMTIFGLGMAGSLHGVTLMIRVRLLLRAVKLLLGMGIDSFLLSFNLYPLPLRQTPLNLHSTLLHTPTRSHRERRTRKPSNPSSPLSRRVHVILVFGGGREEELAGFGRFRFSREVRDNVMHLEYTLFRFWRGFG